MPEEYRNAIENNTLTAEQVSQLLQKYTDQLQKKYCGCKTKNYVADARQKCQDKVEKNHKNTSQKLAEKALNNVNMSDFDKAFEKAKAACSDNAPTPPNPAPADTTK